MAGKQRDDFSAKIIGLLARRVNHVCSNPDCNAHTSGPHTSPDKATSLGVAAHICAAAPGGPRYDANMTPAQRGAIGNGIWLCVNCSTEIDKDPAAFSVALLQQWKQEAEARAAAQIGKPQAAPGVKLVSTFSPRTWQADRIDRFHFSARATDVIGRDVEFAALQAFCDAAPDIRFTWWLMTGKGGMGKSRLAYELGETLARRAPAWDWQFLDNDARLKKNLQTLSEATWQPQRDTLLIVDYAAMAVDELRNAIIACVGAGKRWQHRVRMLVIERTLDGGWYDKLCSSNSGNDQFCVQESRYRPDVLALPALTLTQGRTILQALLARYAATPACDLDQLLEKLDVEHRPLFILFLADALHEGGAQVQWNSDALISQVLKREMVRWETQGVLAVDKQLLCFATLAGEIDLSPALPPYVDKLVAEAENVSQPPLKTRLAIALHGAERDDFIPKLEPDLLGELFVLETVQLAESARDKNKALDQAMLEAVWLMNFGDGAFAFITRAVQDFPHHARLALLVARLAEFCFDDEAQTTTLAQIYHNLCVGYGEKGDLDSTTLHYASVAALSERLPTSAAIALLHAKAAFNLVHYYGNAGHVAQAHAMEGIIAALCLRFRDNQDIALEHAKAAVNLVNYYGKAGQVAQARAMEGIIAALCLRFPDNQDIALEHAKAAFNLVAYYGNAGQMEQACAMAGIIAALCLRFRDNQDITLLHAKAAFNLAIFHWQIEPDQAKPFIELVHAHLAQQPDHPGTMEITHHIQSDELLRQIFGVGA